MSARSLTDSACVILVKKFCAPLSGTLTSKLRSHPFELLFVQRSTKASFFPNAFVFPGGILDNADILGSEKGSPEECILESLKRCALRELFEEVGPLFARPSTIPVSSDFLMHCKEFETQPENAKILRSEVHKNAERFQGWCEERNLRPSTEGLRLWRRWITPKLVKSKRIYDTYFFLGFISDDEEDQILSSIAEDASGEITGFKWISPEEALREHVNGAFNISPPTVYILHELIGMSWESLFEKFLEVDESLVPVYHPQIRNDLQQENSFVSILPGDIEFDIQDTLTPYSHHEKELRLCQGRNRMIRVRTAHDASNISYGIIGIDRGRDISSDSPVRFGISPTKSKL